MGDRKTLHLNKSNVVQIDPAAREISERFDELCDGADSLAIVTSRKGLGDFMVPDDISVEVLPHLICAMRRCLYELECRYEEQHLEQ